MIFSCRKLKFESNPIVEPHSTVGVKMHILKACLLRARFSPAGKRSEVALVLADKAVHTSCHLHYHHKREPRGFHEHCPVLGSIGSSMLWRNRLQWSPPRRPDHGSCCIFDLPHIYKKSSSGIYSIAIYCIMVRKYIDIMQNPDP